MSDVVQVCIDNLSAGVHFCAKLFSTAFWFGLLVEYKYWIVILGALIEGELILMMAAASAYHGHISVYLVAIFAALGAVVHDHALYWLGHKLGHKLKKGKYFARAQKIYKLTDKYGVYFVATFRFLYGIRTITPIMLGASHKFSVKTYSMCVVLSSIIWAIIISYLGYTFALVFDWLSAEFKRIKSIILYVVLGAVIIGLSFYILKKLFQSLKK